MEKESATHYRWSLAVTIIARTWNTLSFIVNRQWFQWCAFTYQYNLGKSPVDRRTPVEIAWSVVLSGVATCCVGVVGWMNREHHKKETNTDLINMHIWQAQRSIKPFMRTGSSYSLCILLVRTFCSLRSGCLRRRGGLSNREVCRAPNGKGIMRTKTKSHAVACNFSTPGKAHISMDKESTNGGSVVASWVKRRLARQRARGVRKGPSAGPAP